MKYKRIFTFGCSFTHFAWPTWPNIMQTDLQLPTQNWGLCGQGNVGMFHRMLEVDMKYSLSETDIVIPVWSTWHREDRYLGSWTLSGNIFYDSHLYDKRFRKKFWHETNDIIKNATAIISANRMFPISYQAKLMGSIETGGDDLYEKHHLYSQYKNFIPEMDDFPWDYTQPDLVNFGGAFDHVDNHPDIEANLHFVKDYIYPALELEMKQETIDYYTDMHNKVVELGKQGVTKKEIKEYHHMYDFFEKHFNFSAKRYGW